MGTGKVFSGSQAGKVKYPYDAMVYKDGTNVFAIDDQGNIIKRGIAGTDDTEVIQSAIDYLPENGVLSFHKGNYVITSTISRLTHFSIEGNGAVMDMRTLDDYCFDLGNPLSLGSTRNVKPFIRDIVFYGDIVNTSSWAIRISNLAYYYINNIKIRLLYNGIKLNGVSYTNIDEVRGAIYYGTVIEVASLYVGGTPYRCNSVTIKNCENSASHAYGVKILCTGDSYTQPQHVIVQNCWFENTGCGIYSEGQGVVIDNNNMLTTSGGVGIHLKYNSGTFHSSEETIISKNKISASGAGCSCIILETPYRQNITNNILYSSPGNVINIRTNNAQGLIIEGNYIIISSTGVGIYNEKEITRSIINGNTFYGSTSSTLVGTSISGTDDIRYNSICNNLIIGNEYFINNTSTTYCGIFGNNLKGGYPSVNPKVNFGSNIIHNNIINNRGIVIESSIREIVSSLIFDLGDTLFISPFIEDNGTNVKDYSRRSNDLTSSDDLSAITNVSNRSRYIYFDGSSYYLYRTNDTDFDFGDSAVDNAFSIVVAVSPDDVTSRQVIGKWDENNQREWRLFFDANGYPTIQLYDESVDKYIGRQDQTAFTTGSWKVLVATYDGSAVSGGCKIYIDGVQLDDADYEAAGYVAMEAVTANLTVGALKNAAAYSEYFDGKMTWIGVAAKELSADEVWSLTQRLKGVLGI